MEEEEIHVAVGRNFRREKANVLWAAANFPRATIVLVHVHWPSKWMPFTLGGRVLYKLADEKEKERHRDREKEATVKMLLQYKRLCGQRKVKAHYLEHEDVLAGIANLIKRLKIKRLVIGSRKMAKQAVIRECCQVWVLDNGKHISTSNDHLKHTASMGYGWNQESLASIHELSNDLSDDGYTTARCDLDDDEEVIQMDDTNQLEVETEMTAEENGEISVASQDEVENVPELESTDSVDELLSPRNAADEAEKLKEEIDRLKKKLKEIEVEGHKTHNQKDSPRQKEASLKEKSLSKPRYPELQVPEHISDFSMPQLDKATDKFHCRNFIGEGGYGPVYKGKLYGIPVAIKLLRTEGRQGHPEFKQEVLILSRIEHPHIVKLIGVCLESCALVYEHLPNGTLRERLREGLPWKDRVRILGEQRSALVYLHASRPHAIIHADLKLTNILLDANNVSRLGDFGTARMVHMKPLDEETVCRKTNPMGTTGYMDPMFLVTGELTPECDVYAFGVIILQLLTGLLELNIAEQVEEAVRMGVVRRTLDASAGEWPAVQAERLLRLALKCCSLERKRRPEITSTEWRTLDILQAMAGKSRIF